MSGTLMIVVTHGRAGRVHTLKSIPGIPLCVSESQAPLYAKAHPGVELVVHPDAVKGISPKRQWVLDYAFGNGYENAMMVDDGLKDMVDVSTPPGQDPTVPRGQTIRDLVERLFDMSRGLGAYLVGFNDFGHPAMYKPQQPFALVGTISGGFVGVRDGGGLFFPKAPGLLTDDIWVSGLNAYLNRKLLKDLRYACKLTETFGDLGGMSTIRTNEGLHRSETLMRDAFGDQVYVREASPFTKLKNDGQVNVKVPW